MKQIQCDGLLVLVVEDQMAVLISAGREFILFLVAGIVLCFGFSMRIMLIIQWHFSSC